MYKAKPYKAIDGSEIFICETSKHYDVVEAEEVYVFTEDELEGNSKALVNAINVIRDRAKQEIKKTKADEHGYRLLKANIPEKKNSDGGYLIKKTTPYSLEINPEVVKKCIIQDLCDYYNGFFNVNNLDLGERLYQDRPGVYNEIINIDQMLSWIRSGKITDKEDEDIVKTANYLLRKGIDFERPIVYKLEQLSGNIANGHYEVTYLATDII